MAPYQPSHSRAVGCGVMLAPVLLFGGGWIGNAIAHFFGWW